MILYYVSDLKILENLAKIALKNKPISSTIEIQSLESLIAEDSFVVALKTLFELAKTAEKDINIHNMQSYLLDIAEFITIFHTKLCTKNISILVQLRPLFIEIEALVERIESSKRIDKRVLQIFMNNTIGPNKFFAEGAMGSIFRRTRSKIFRAVDMSWNIREKTIEEMVKLVPDRRRRILVNGRPEIRGYEIMSDQELLAWSQFSKELQE